MWKKLMKELNLSDSYISMGLGLLVVLVVGVLLFNYFSGKSTSVIEEGKEEMTQEEIIEELLSSLPATHTVAQGETLWSISEKYYQSGYNWVDIAKENGLVNPNLLEAGQTLTIPRAEPILAEAAQDLDVPQNYTVQPNDSLWKIAINIYQDGYRWVDIANANNLTNPNVIHVGNVLVLPK